LKPSGYAVIPAGIQQLSSNFLSGLPCLLSQQHVGHILHPDNILAIASYLS